MPWVNKNKCIGCGICTRKCPANAIIMKDNKAEIDMEKCIRCGKCHEFCPQNAIRHDSEKIPLEIKNNIENIKKTMKNFNTEKNKKDFLKRIKKHFNKEKIVAEKTIKEIEKITKKL
jgi:formate hydrogenlyase subunit 6/NADH:ubiquinone oxidoreductase subunit I